MDVQALDPATRVTINGGTYSALLGPDSSFALRDIPEGDWLLEILSSQYHFPKVKLSINTSDMVVPNHYVPDQDWESTGAELAYPLHLAPYAERVYFVPRSRFGLLKMLASPYMLMTFVSLGATLLLPKMQQTIDNEKAKILEQETQAVSTQAVSTQKPSMPAKKTGAKSRRHLQ